MATALIVIAEGFEEIEAVSVIDILRRGGIRLTVAGLTSTQVKGAHGLAITTDTLLESVKSDEFDALIIPGGEPGTTNLEKNDLVADLLKNQAESGRTVAAICAAPRILNGLGLLSGKRGTSYPSNADRMTDCTYVEDRVVVDSNIITSRGPGTAMEFGYAILESLKSKDISDRLKQAMLAVS